MPHLSLCQHTCGHTRYVHVPHYARWDRLAFNPRDASGVARTVMTVIYELFKRGEYDRFVVCCQPVGVRTDGQDCQRQALMHTFL